MSQKNDKSIDITLDSSSNNITLYTTTAAVHDQTADTLDKESPNNSKNDQNLIPNVSVDDDSQFFETSRKITTLSFH